MARKPALIAVMFAATLASATIHRVPEQFATIRMAVEAASRGDSIVVAPGVHNCTVTLDSNNDLHIGSILLLFPDSLTAEPVIVMPDSSIHPDSLMCFGTIGPDASLELVGLTLTNGYGIRRPAGQRVGGAVYCSGASLSMHKVTCMNNFATFGVACWVDSSDNSSFVECVFRENGRDDGEFYQSAIRALDSEILIRNSVFVSNVVSGGAAVIATESILGMSNCRVDSNGFQETTASPVSVVGGECTIDRVSFRYNVASPDWSASCIHIQEATATVTFCDFIGNTSGSTTAAYFGDSESVIRNCRFLQNNTLEYGPGNVLVADGHARFVRCQFSENIAPTSTVLLANGDVEMDSCIFSNNICTNANRAVIHSYYHDLRIRQSSFLGNSPVAVSSLDDNNAVLIDADSNYWGSPSGPFHAERNTFGQGDTVMGDSVDFTPWLDEDPLGAAESPPVPVSHAFFRAFPNPFNSSVTLEYEVAHEQEIKITIYDLLGREVESLLPGRLQEGVHHTIWNAESFASGIYLARLTSEDNRQLRMTTKLLLVK